MKKLSGIIAVIILLCLPASARAADETAMSGFRPYIYVQGEYNDNIYLSSTNKKDDYITTVTPGIKYTNSDAMSGVDLDFNLGFVTYGKETTNNYTSASGSLNAKYLTKEHVNFYLRDTFIRSENPRENEIFTTTQQNQQVLSTQNNRAIYWRNVLAPTIEYQFGAENRLGLNYRNNIYRTESATSENSQEDYINPFIDYWFDQRNGLHLEYGYTIGSFDRSADMTGHMANVRYTNRFAPKASVFGEYTFTRREFSEFNPPSTDYDIHEPSVGITYTFSPTWNASGQVGYFWQEPVTGSKMEGYTYKANIVNRDAQTTYVVSLQGGYNEDYFTSENLGLNRYHRLTGSITHSLEKRTSISFAGNIERVDYSSQDRGDWIWGTVGTLSHTPLKWLTLALELSHRELDSNIDTNDYTENRVMIRISASY
jgi:hypothetical protein